jgi:hypothetical protein
MKLTNQGEPHEATLEECVNSKLASTPSGYASWHAPCRRPLSLEKPDYQFIRAFAEYYDREVALKREAGSGDLARRSQGFGLEINFYVKAQFPLKSN